jgi:hypothetical protein
MSKFKWYALGLGAAAVVAVVGWVVAKKAA